MAKPRTFTLGGPGRAPATVVSVEVVRLDGGYAARGITPAGSLVRVPIPGATVDGKPVPPPTPDEQRDLAAERSPIAPGEPKPAPAEVDGSRGTVSLPRQEGARAATDPARGRDRNP